MMRQLVDGSFDGTSPSADGGVLSFNRAAERIWVPAPSVIGAR
jgi:hypothetical protein